MAMQRKPGSARRPPSPSEGYGDVEHWISRVMPDLHPIVESLDEQIREQIPELRYAVKWKRPNVRTWMRRLDHRTGRYDMSVNVVFFGGADFDPPPPLGDTDRSRYVRSGPWMRRRCRR